MAWGGGGGGGGGWTSGKGLKAFQRVARNIRKHRCYRGEIMGNLKQCFEMLRLRSDMFLNKDSSATTKT